VNLQEVDTIQDLKEWVEENMPGARLTEDSAGDIVIHTGLVSTMGGYLAIGEGYDGGDWVVLRCACDECEEYEVENKGYQLARGRQQWMMR
jgi:hypothetical protein